MPSDLQPVELDFFDSAPYRYVTAEAVHWPAETIFAALVDPAGWGHWFPGFSRSGRYVTPDPHGVGTVREVSMAGLRYTSTILAWDPPGRWAFRLSTSTIPFAFALAEEYLVTPHPHHSVVQWTFAIDPRPVMRPAMPLVHVALPRIFRRAMTNLSIHLAHQSSIA
jgi:uncharacterized protein YndB with AHSA1/START domain